LEILGEKDGKKEVGGGLRNAAEERGVEVVVVVGKGTETDTNEAEAEAETENDRGTEGNGVTGLDSQYPTAKAKGCL
jgi:hypothetical protein